MACAAGHACLWLVVPCGTCAKRVMPGQGTGGAAVRVPGRLALRAGLLTEGRLWCGTHVPDTPDAPDLLAALQEANARLRAENGDLRAENAELKARLARLERLASRNSGNSSMAPSGDDQPGKKPPEPRKRGGGKRKPGKQRGAPGAHLEWNENPDDTVPCFPGGGLRVRRQPGRRPRPGREVLPSGH